MAMNNLGLAMNAMKRFEEAVDALGRSVTRCRRVQGVGRGLS
ncbi:tetratricopeptide repeat protein [Streptomyces sp. NBC_00885]